MVDLTAGECDSLSGDAVFSGFEVGLLMVRETKCEPCSQLTAIGPPSDQHENDNPWLATTRPGSGMGRCRYQTRPSTASLEDGLLSRPPGVALTHRESSFSRVLPAHGTILALESTTEQRRRVC